ncbi:MAG TPA: tRNA (adenosine(37)-N6)-threonylcarbamoyltransferase complex ATPase subunit type 1 TsaE [Candidatus Krumholzibacteria bacterium]|nr:tRNA (adenosine(37)-N6)-threonylcarbamoyltransferase complex ATPase subunit type 1 TsaE [Candidatus Krumholzibacteria bacterium]
MASRRVIACTVHTASEAETARFGAELGECLTHGACVSLVGPLGAGKTVLVGGLCRGLGIREEVVSPTFILLETFEGRLPVVHIDLYRLEHERELEELGAFDFLAGGAVLLVEWGDRSPRLNELADVEIRIEGSGGERTITVHAIPELAEDFAEIAW